MKMNEMGERPPMPEMRGANMKREDPLGAMPQQGRENLMKPSRSIGAVLVARLANMSQQELSMLDKAITPEVARVLMKLLPELQELIGEIEGMNARQPQRPQMGALGNMG